VPADGPPQPQFSEACRLVGMHIAEVIIASATDAGQRSIYEQDRTRMVRTTAEACTTNAWSELAIKCYGKAKTAADLKACETKYTPPPPPRPRPTEEPQTRQGSAAGSAAPRPGPGSAAPQRERPGSAAAKGAGSAAAPRAGAGSGSARRL
jgi:hypothetical protein